MKSKAAATASSKKDSEEAFLTLLQRIQRQYSPPSSSASENAADHHAAHRKQNSTVVIPAIVGRQQQLQRPPDEAATALGRQLARTFHSVAVMSTQQQDGKKNNRVKKSQPDNEEDSASSSPLYFLPEVPKGIQEKALRCLVDRHVNPALIFSFLMTLVGSMPSSSSNSAQHHQSKNHQPLVRMDWLPNWILHAESVILEDEDARAGSEPSYQALSSMIRAFAYYQASWHRHYFQHPRKKLHATPASTTATKTRSHSTSALLTPHNNHQDILRIATTFRRFKTSSARMIMIREWIHIAFGSGLGSSSGSTPSSAGVGRGDGVHDEAILARQLQSMLSPLLAASVLTLQTSISETMLFMECLWRECWAEMTTWSDSDFMAGLEWLSQSLNLYLWGIPCYRSSAAFWGHLTASKELAVRWLLQMLELASFLSQASSAASTGASVEAGNQQYLQYETMTQLAKWLSQIVSGTLPRISAILPSYQISLEGILSQILQIIQRISLHPQAHMIAESSHKGQESPFCMDAVATLRLAALTLANPIPADVQLLLQILHITTTGMVKGSIQVPVPPETQVGLTTSKSEPSSATRTGDLYLSSVTSMAILRGMASMLLRSDGCQTTSRNLIAALSNSKLLPKSKAMKKMKANRSTSGKPENVIQFLEESMVDVDNFVSFLAKENSFIGSHCSAMQQTGCLLFGIALLMDNPKYQVAAYKFLGHLLEAYPHLGISLLPVMVDCINAACVKGDGRTLQRQLEFLCTSVVQDPQCAREIWNLLGVELMKPTTPTVIRATITRFFPKLCMANKRLYRRVMEALGSTLAASPHNLEIRVSVAATIADLAMEDRIRDVTDVIGWIQGFITDISWIRSVSTLDEDNSSGNAALVHYAILALHHLIRAEEMDFSLVLVVLNKRLCKVFDMKEVTLLPPLVLETLVLLLGDGECEVDDEDDDEVGALKPVGVPSQVSNSVDTLINLALHSKFYPSKANQDLVLKGTLLRCRRNIYISLANYSMDALGIDDLGVQAVTEAVNDPDTPAIPPSGERYISLRRIVEDGIQILASGSYKVDLAGDGTGKNPSFRPEEVQDNDLSSSLGELIAILLKFEENALGSALWQRRGKKKGNAKSKRYVQGQIQADASQISALPSPSSVQKIYNGKRCSSNALAVMLTFEGKPLSLFGDLAGDIVHESCDPLVLAFTVQAFLNAARSTLMELIVSLSSSEGLENVLMGIREWRYRLDNPDNMYLALASLALLIPDILGPYGDHSPYVIEICDEIWKAYTCHDFESLDIAKICIGLVGVCAARSQSMDRLHEIVDALEISVSGYGGQTSFGAYYSVAVIAQACTDFFGQRDSDGGDLGLIGRIVGFLVNELVGCVSGNNSTLTALVTCIQGGEISPDTIDDLTNLNKKPLKMIKSKKQTAKSIFISLAICIPALSSVNNDLLLGLYCFLDVIPWGYGKGMALSSILQACKRAGLFKTREIEKIYSKYAKIFEEGMDKGVPGLDDIFYAVTATTTKTIPYSIRRFLVGNRTLFDDDERAVTLLAAVISLSSLPCLGCGSTSFAECAQLSTRASKEDILGVNTLISEAIESPNSTSYSEIAVLLMGFLASINNFANIGEASDHTRGERVSEMFQTSDSKLPVAQQGTILEVVVEALSERLYGRTRQSDNTDTNLLVTLLGCLEVLSLPGNFAAFLEQTFRGTDDVKTSCTKILISQIRGRPRAVFDGRDYIELALKMAKMPVTTIKSLLGQGDAPTIFIEALVDLVPKFSTDSAADVVENFWRLSFNQVGNLPGMSMAFLGAMKTLVKSGGDKKSFLISPKTLGFLRNFLVTRVFAGIRDAPWTNTSIAASVEERSIVEAYSDCLLELPVTSLLDADFFNLKELDGFAGEALRYRCVMILVRKQYFKTPSRASSEISSAIAWFSRQLTSSEEETFSSTLLQVACSIAEATSGENSLTRRELLLTLLDNLLLTGPSASFVGLQMLGVLVCRWVNGEGADGDLSLISIISTQMDRWKELSPPTLQQTFRILVHDLPFNLATYARAEKLSGVVFNRLWRIYNTWFEQGAEQDTLECVRRALICCRSPDSSGENFASLATLMLI